MITSAQLKRMAIGKPSSENMGSVLTALDEFGEQFGLDRLHRLAHYLAQLLHESGSFKYDREIWGPTPAQKKYEGRKDLGNTKPGDGSKFRGYTPIQITGRANTTEFYKWCKKNFPQLEVPNFVEKPELMNTDPWEGLGPIWYWHTRDLNSYADDNNIEMITRKINGGLNGFEDRMNYYVRASLVLLGYGPLDVKKFQQDHKEAGNPDGVPGLKTRMALHKALSGLNPFREETEVVVEVEKEVEVEKPVVPKEVEKAVSKDTSFWGWLTSIIASGGGLGAWLLNADIQTVAIFGAVAVGGLVVVLLLGPLMVRRIKAIRQEIEA